MPDINFVTPFDIIFNKSNDLSRLSSRVRQSHLCISGKSTMILKKNRKVFKRNLYFYDYCDESHVKH